MRNLFAMHAMEKALPKTALALVLMISIGLSLSFEFGPQSFGPKQTKYIQNFESGTLGNWTNSSLWIANTATTPLNGSYSMFFQGTGTGNTRLFAANQTGGTSGWQDIQIVATVKTNALDSGENLTLSVYDGTTWYTIWSQEDVDAQTDTWNLNSTFFNNANFAVNFTCVSNGGANERCWVDDFAIRGTPLGGLRITNLTIAPVNGSSVAMNQYSLFNVTATAQCNSGSTGECGDVNASLYYNSTNLVPNKLVNTTAGETPFWTYNITSAINFRPSSYATNGTFPNPTQAYDLSYNDTTTDSHGSVSTNSINYTYTNVSANSVLFYTFRTLSGGGAYSYLYLYNFTGSSYYILQSYNSALSITTYSFILTSDFINSSSNIMLIVYDNYKNATYFTNTLLYDTYINKPVLTISNPQTCSAMLQGQNCTAIWQVNATGTPSSQYWLNVSFNSESSYINPNDSGNFQINISASGPATYAFTITVPGNNYSNSSTTPWGGGNPSMNFTYNGTWGGTQSYVNCSFNYSGATYWQNTATPALKFTNLGSTALTWTIAMNNSLPSWVTLFANDTSTIPSNSFVFTSSNSLALSVASSGTKSLWVYANFSGVADYGGTVNYTQLNHTST